MNMKRIVYKWDLEDFINSFNEMGLKSTFEKIKGRNAVLVKVANFEEMKNLFGYGRSMWAIAYDKRYWNQYVEDKNRWQFVYLNFDVKKEGMGGSAFAFTYSPKENMFTDAANRDNASQISCESIKYILERILDCPFEIIKNMK